MLETLIIGSGYLGSFIKSKFKSVQSSSLENTADFYFSLELSPFDELPPAKTLIITCSTEMMGDRAKAFAQFSQENFNQIILISTASLFQVSHADEVIDENAPLISSHPRVISEGYFEKFATILHCGLLWDETLRTPRKWLNRIKNGQKYVNFCKSDLVAEVCFHITHLEGSLRGHFLCADNHAKRWNEIAKSYSIKLDNKETGTESKILNSKKLQLSLKSKIDWSSFVYCIKKEPL
ncbi:hypothetical protein PQO03_20815 [Lentisphaera profundi]|uniref:RmlD-like substrate binding domain-containing protein n=1 Tax=Lentisphaera profundi TaxID=1658616 RepID=A0ABY7VZG9_9BACT|nr:hypothetical protein [Lentisphaera profundi]WDE98262.1 hypothetical protein PQO03_20815 [Lentisphaera profundi]